ncbi:hypothetical protein [Flavivirga jejuensis]|uniref:Uncharacterized protein n=1 Tax=Flavivirga jejuensis TaxID=870487 RepID=A0ABT8WMN5_9FLAO|nr:hypothetical protein [Flavivirga jejuensis]MDO5974290.1 hypothetical protein [Flavivirga jejuensis]
MRIKKGCMFAAAKNGSDVKSEVHKNNGFYIEKKRLNFFFKKDLKSIVGMKKGFYICTR